MINQIKVELVAVDIENLRKVTIKVTIKLFDVPRVDGSYERIDTINPQAF